MLSAVHDIRDSQKIKTLPSDLQSIADEMLKEKFGLSEQGEVVGTKPRKENEGSQSQYSVSVDPCYTSIRFTTDDLRKVHESISEQRSTTRDGLTVREWLQKAMLVTSSEESFAVGYRITLRGIYTGRHVTRYIQKHEMREGAIAWYIDKVQREALEPVIIMDH